MHTYVHMHTCTHTYTYTYTYLYIHTHIQQDPKVPMVLKARQVSTARRVSLDSPARGEMRERRVLLLRALLVRRCFVCSLVYVHGACDCLRKVKIQVRLRCVYSKMKAMFGTCDGGFFFFAWECLFKRMWCIVCVGLVSCLASSQLAAVYLEAVRWLSEAVPWFSEAVMWS